MNPVADALGRRLNQRIDRYNSALDLDENADRSEILSSETAALRTNLIVAAMTDDHGGVIEASQVDGKAFWVAAWAAEFRGMAFATAGEQSRSLVEAANALRLWLVVDLVRPEDVPPHVRARIDSLTPAGAVRDPAYLERELAELLLADGSTDLAALDLGIALARRAIQRDGADRTQLWQALLRMQRQRYGLTSLVEDATAALDAARHLLAHVSSRADRVIVLSQLGVLEQEYYDRTSESASLRRCVAALAEALELAPADHPTRAVMLVNLGFALCSRGSRERSPDDLDRAVDLIREALLDRTVGGAHRASALSMLAVALHARFDLLSRADDLSDALAAARTSARFTNEDDLAVRLGNLGLILMTQYQRSRHPEDLAELIAVARRRAAVASGDQHQLGRALGLLTVALTQQAQSSGRIEELNEAIDAGRAAVTALADHPVRAYELHNLAKALLLRFRFSHGLADLDDGIRTARLAADTSPTDDPHRAGRLSMLSGALQDRYNVTDDIDDLLGAVAAGEEAVRSSPASSFEHASLLSNLSNARRELAVHSMQLSDANAAIDVAARAASIDGHTAANAPKRLTNLAAAYTARFRITGDLDDLDHAIRLLRQTIPHVPVDSPDRCLYLSNLAQRLIERHFADPDRACAATLTEAVARLREAAEMPQAPAVERVTAAGRWGFAAARQGLPQEAAAGYAAAVRLLPVVAWHGLDRRSQEQQLTKWTPIVASAAGWAIDVGRPAEAVELLEQGRGVLWSHQIGRRSDLAALRDVRPELADRLEEIRRVLDAGGPPV